MRRHDSEYKAGDERIERELLPSEITLSGVYDWVRLVPNDVNDVTNETS